MAKRRTKKEKMIARLRRQIARQRPTPAIQPRSPVQPDASPPPASIPASRPDNLLLYDPRLITKDLRKTGLYSLIFITLLLGLYWFFELGGQGSVNELLQSLPVYKVN